jgi:hypothetical protein
MIWPWSEIARLKRRIAEQEARDTWQLWRLEARENMWLKTVRELAAANKGIRRLKDRIKRLERVKP